MTRAEKLTAIRELRADIAAVTARLNRLAGQLEQKPADK